MGKIHGGNIMRTIDKIITPLDCSRGAPMGRQNIGKRPTDKKVFDCFVPMCDHAYDKGGAYWGASIDGVRPLRVAYTKDLSYIFFYRSYERREAPNDR